MPCSLRRVTPRVSSAQPLSLHRWHHVAIVFHRAKKLEVFFNGQPQAPARPAHRTCLCLGAFSCGVAFFVPSQFRKWAEPSGPGCDGCSWWNAASTPSKKSHASLHWWVATIPRCCACPRRTCTDAPSSGETLPVCSPQTRGIEQFAKTSPDVYRLHVMWACHARFGAQPARS